MRDPGAKATGTAAWIHVHAALGRLPDVLADVSLDSCWDHMEGSQGKDRKHKGGRKCALDKDHGGRSHVCLLRCPGHWNNSERLQGNGGQKQAGQPCLSEKAVSMNVFSPPRMSSGNTEKDAGLSNCSRRHRGAHR